MDVVKARIAVVHANQNLVRESRRGRIRDGVDARERRQVAGFAVAQVDGVDAPILIAVRILRVEDEVGVVRPEVGSDSPLGVPRDGAGGAQVGYGGDPDVQNTVERREPRDARTVPAHRDRLALRIAEQRLSGDYGGWHGVR